MGKIMPTAPAESKVNETVDSLSLSTLVLNNHKLRLYDATAKSERAIRK